MKTRTKLAADGTVLTLRQGAISGLWSWRPPAPPAPKPVLTPAEAYWATLDRAAREMWRRRQAAAWATDPEAYYVHEYAYAHRNDTAASK